MIEQKIKLDNSENVFTEDHFIEVLESLHKNQIRMETVLRNLKQIISGFSWLEEGGRACYECDDDLYYAEIGHCFDGLREEIEKGRQHTVYAHRVCCDRYRHVNPENRTAVQMRLDYGFVDYPEFIEDVMKFTSIEGAL